MTSKKFSSFLRSLPAIAALAALCGCAADNGAMRISSQGSFAVGGSVSVAPGEFNADTLAPAGQSYHGDHAYVFYQIPEGAKNTRWYSSTATGSRKRPGKALRTAATASRTFS